MKIKDMIERLRKCLIKKLGGYTEERVYTVHTLRRDSVPLRVVNYVSDEDIKYVFNGDVSEAERYSMCECANKLSTALTHFLVMEKYYDYETCCLRFSATLEVVDPNLKRQ